MKTIDPNTWRLYFINQAHKKKEKGKMPTTYFKTETAFLKAVKAHKTTETAVYCDCGETRGAVTETGEFLIFCPNCFESAELKEKGE